MAPMLSQGLLPRRHHGAQTTERGFVCYNSDMGHLADLLDRIAEQARRGGLDIDHDPYIEAGRDPYRPVLLGSGTLHSQIGFFGRDPGRTEARTGEPFVGTGGQLVRRALWRAAGRHGAPSFEESISVGQTVFWANTVPYKPVGNKAWSMAVKRRFAPLIQELLVDLWEGEHLLTLGNQAFHWFGIADPSLKPALASFWRREDRYHASLPVELAGKTIVLHPLPHPSPLNARWHGRFPDLLEYRLRALSWNGGTGGNA